jgi:hypothetical protein
MYFVLQIVGSDWERAQDPLKTYVKAITPPRPLRISCVLSVLIQESATAHKTYELFNTTNEVISLNQISVSVAGDNIC